MESWSSSITKDQLHNCFRIDWNRHNVYVDFTIRTLLGKAYTSVKWLQIILQTACIKFVLYKIK